MPRTQRLSFPLKLTLLLYLLALVGVGGYLFWPEPRPAPLRVTSVRLAPEGDRIVVEGEGFSAATRVSLALDVSNQRFLRHTVPTWGWGGDLVRDGQFAYATTREKGLLVLDLVVPDRPRIVATLGLPGKARNLVVAAGVAYVACDQAGLALVDISEPASPELLSVLPELAMVQRLAVGDGRLYVSMFGSGVAPVLAVVDVGNPRQPQLVGRQPLPEKPLGLALWEDQLLIAAGKEGLLTLVLGRGMPQVWSRISLPGSAQSILVVGEQAYVTCSSGVLAVIKLGAFKPHLLAQVPLVGVHNRLAAESGRLYLTDPNGGGQVLDIEHPRQPRSIGLFSAPRGALGMAVLGQRVYLNTNDQGIQILDLSEPALLQSVGQIHFGEKILAVALEKNLVAVTTGSGNLHLLKGFEGDSLHHLASLPLKGVARAVQLKDRYAYVHMLDYGLEVIDLSDPAMLFSLTAYPLEGIQNIPVALITKTTLVLKKNRGSLVDASGRIWLFDVAEDGGGELFRRIEFPIAVGGVGLGEDRMYAIGGRGDIWPIALGPKGEKIYPAFQLPAQKINELAVLGTVVVAACGLEGVYIVDFNDPAAPRLLAVLALPIRADQIRLQGTTAYVAASQGGLQQIDLSDPANPRPGGLLDHDLNTESFAVSGSQALLASGSTGLVVVPLPQLLQPLTGDAEQMSLALPPIDTPGHYTLRVTDGAQSIALPGVLELGGRPLSLVQRVQDGQP